MLTEPDTPLNDAYHVGSFDFLEFTNMQKKEHQPALKIDQLISNLKSKNLKIEDEE